MDRLRTVLSRNSPNDDEESGGIMSDIDEAVTLSWETRLYGFVGCFLLGLLCSILGTMLVFSGKFKGFGIMFSLGSIISLGSTCFLMGPVKQVQKMFHSKRWLTTVIFLVSIVLTFWAGFVVQSGLLALIFAGVQYAAMIWYSLSYIPYARDAVSKCLCACLD